MILPLKIADCCCTVWVNFFAKFGLFLSKLTPKSSFFSAHFFFNLPEVQNLKTAYASQTPKWACFPSFFCESVLEINFCLFIANETR